MYDLKYHVASIVGIFLALGLGMFIGTVLDDNGSMVQKQEKIVQSLKADFDKLRLENQNLQDANSQLTKADGKNQQFGEKVMPALVSGKLRDKKIMLIGCGDSKVINIAAHTVELAGGKVIKTVAITDKFNTDVISNNENATGSAAEENKKATDKKLAELSGSIALNYAKGIETDDMKKLNTNGVVLFEGEDAKVQPDVIIVVNGYETAEDSMFEFVDKPVVRQLTDANFRVIGTETSVVSYSLAEQYKKLDIDTIDNIDKPAGMLSLVYVCAGWEGNYGEKPEAAKFMPEKVSPGVLAN